MTSSPEITADDLAELITLMDRAADAYIRGDVRQYIAIFDHGDDYTLMPPYGGETGRGFDDSESALEATSRFFTAGEATLEVEQSYTSGDLAVLVGVERQHAEIGGLPDQDWSLRVTVVFRRAGNRWQIVHRHADPLVRPIPFPHCAELARGLGRTDQSATPNQKRAKSR
ncbi:YybH family protein [Microlunatus speluncae]|uniref:YybH family protein n=1 Tax=Microlunatus speluncae TaxID=2594267 RepID=UPI0012661864|nr:nuclear transport factor 2 family protein [Microlunatus speluncae]